MSRLKHLDIELLLGGEPASDAPTLEKERAPVAGLIKKLENYVCEEYLQAHFIRDGRSLSAATQKRMLQQNHVFDRSGKKSECTWPDVLRLLVEIEAHPKDYMCAFLNRGSQRPKYRVELTSSVAQNRYREYIGTPYTPPIERRVEDWCEKISSKAAANVCLGMGLRLAWSQAFSYDQADSAPPIVPFALGDAAGLDWVADRFRYPALIGVVFERTRLVRHCPELTASLLEEADAAREAILKL